MRKLIGIALLGLCLGGCSQTVFPTQSRLLNTGLGAGAGCLIGAGTGALFVAPHAVALGTGIGCAAGAVTGFVLPASGL